MILSLVQEAVDAGARQARACEELGLEPRTLQRWRREGVGDDRRQGLNHEAGNKLSPGERCEVLALLTSPVFRDLPPSQIVPRLADTGRYVASESTMYRLLREEKLSSHRDRTRPPIHRRPREQVATGPGQVISWDITYLPSPVRGVFFFLYLFLDVWSRKILAARVFESEDSELAAQLFEELCAREGLSGAVLHADNGGPMKGSTMLATLQRLHVATSFSRPGVSDDNPFSESLFRTLKYRPEYPEGPFGSLAEANEWVEAFVRWYNTEHLHSKIRFVTPEDRHTGRDREILANRAKIYEQARRQRPERWSRNTRNWEPVETVRLNPEKKTKIA